MLAEASQIRKEADDTGPLTELEYWKQRTAKFSCLVDQIKTQPCRGVITTLVAAKSKIIKVSVHGFKLTRKLLVYYFHVRSGASWTLTLQMLPMNPEII